MAGLYTGNAGLLGSTSALALGTGVGLGTGLDADGAATLAKTETFVEPWDSFSTATWTSPLTPANVTVAFNQVNILGRNAYDSDINTKTHYDLTGSYIQTEFLGMASGTRNTGSEGYFAFKKDVNNILQFGIEGTQLVGYYVSAGVYNEPGARVTFGNSHSFMRIREAAGTIYWETSPDGGAGTWMTLWTVSVATLGWTPNNGTISMGAGGWMGATMTWIWGRINSTGTWFASSSYDAADGTEPALLMDPALNRFAAPALSGTELVTNGTFDTNTTGWTTSGSVTPSVSGGILTLTAAAGGWEFRQALTLTPGKLYRLTYRLRNSVAGDNNTTFKETVNNSNYMFRNGLPTTFTTYESYHFAVTAGAQIQFGGWTAGSAMEIDFVSVREVVLGSVGTNLGASGYTMGGSTVATESPSGQLNLTGNDLAPGAYGDKQLTGLTVGATYLIVFRAGANGCTYYVGTAQGLSDITQILSGSANTWVYAAFKATQTTHWLRIRHVPSSATTVSSIMVAAWTPATTLYEAPFSHLYTFTRTGTANYVASTGFLTSAATDLPRWDYTDGTRRLLIEPAATNLCTRSADWSNASWAANNMTQTPASGTSPDGTNTATLLNEGTANGIHRYEFNATLTAPASISCYMKQGTGRYGYLYMVGSAFNPYYTAVFDLQTGTVATTTSGGASAGTFSAKITSAGNGWYRCSLSVTSGSAGSWSDVGIADSASPTYSNGQPTHLGTSRTIYVWGFQMENNAQVTSYIATSGSTATRNAETCAFSPLFLALINLPAYSHVWRGQMRDASTIYRAVAFSASSASNQGQINTATNTSSRNANSTVLDATFGSGGFTTGFGVAIGQDGAGRSIVANGGAVATDAVAYSVAKVTAYIGRDEANTTNPGAVWIKEGRLYPARVSDASISALGVVS